MNHEGHDAQEEAHEGGLRRVRSTLPPATEAILTSTIGCAISVHRALGPGFLESIYRKALCIELAAKRIAFEEERGIAVVYRGVSIPGQRVDLLVAKVLIVELKCVDNLQEIHTRQVLSYLRTMGLRAGLLINFKVPRLQMGLKRIVL